MFHAQKRSVGAVPVLVLHGPQSQLVIAYGVGAAVTRLQLAGKTILSGPKTSDALKTNKAFEGTVLFPFPNRIRDGRYEWQRKQFQLPRNFPSQQHAIHGFVHNKPFVLRSVRCTNNSATATVEYEHTRSPGYPFAFVLQVKYVLTTTKLTVQLAVRNVGRVVMPFGAGWHPYFDLGPLHKCSLQLGRAQKLICDTRQIPTGVVVPGEFTKPLLLKGIAIDDCFRTRTATLNSPKGILRIRAEKQWPYLQVYLPPHRRCIAIEPQTCAPDAFNNKQGLLTLKPGKLWCGKFSVELRGAQK